MGCWNQTCAITNLPILSSEPVYTFFLRHTGTTADRCYSSSFWQLYPFHFTGKYNEYGSVDDCTGDFLQYILDYIKKELVILPITSDNDIIIKREGFNVDAMFEYDHEEVLYLNSDNTYLRQEPGDRFTHIQIRKNVLDTILAQMTVSIRNPELVYSNGVYNTDVYRIDIGYDYIHSDFTKTINQYHELQWSPEYSESATDVKYNRISKLFLLRHEIENSNRIHLYNVSGAYSLCGLVEAAILDVIAIEDETQRQIMMKELAHQLTVCYMLIHFFEKGRRAFCPTTGAGSQNESTNCQKLLANIILAESKVIETYYDDDEECDEDEDE